MEFIINEEGCRVLCADMLEDMRQLAVLIGEIDAKDSVLKAALGDDYKAIEKTIKVMVSELDSAYSELQKIIVDMKEYISRVHQARVVLD